MFDGFTWLWILIALPYVIVPIFLKLRPAFLMSPKIRKLFKEYTPSIVRAEYANYDEKLIELGFEYSFDCIVEDYIPYAHIYMRYYLLAAHRTYAVSYSVTIEQEELQPVNSALFFCSYCKDGMEKMTLTCDALMVPIKPEYRSIQMVFDDQNLEAVLKAHLKFLTKAPLCEPILIPMDKEHEFIANLLQKELNAHTANGGLSLNPSKKVYQMTWAGAFLFAWYSMWPISLIRRAYQKIKAQRLLKA